jgi:hypothetical protein
MRRNVLNVAVLAVIASFMTWPLSAATNAVEAASSSASSRPVSPRKIDIDLVRMSKTMRDAWSLRIIEQPEKVAGKIVRICGDFCVYDEGAGSPRRYVCALKDPAGCCAIGEVEFRLRGKHEWPKDFPEAFTVITVSGRIEVARNGEGEAQPRLVDAEMEWKKGK